MDIARIEILVKKYIEQIILPKYEEIQDFKIRTTMSSLIGVEFIMDGTEIVTEIEIEYDLQTMKVMLGLPDNARIVTLFRVE